MTGGATSGNAAAVTNRGRDREGRPQDPGLATLIGDSQPLTGMQSRKSEVGSRKSEASEVGDWEIPAELDDPEIRELLAEFAAMRRRIKKPIRDFKATSRVFKQFDDREHLRYALETCVANDYQGLKPDYRPRSRNARGASGTWAEQRVSASLKAVEDFANG